MDDLADDVLVREVEIGPVGHDAALGLNGDLGALGGAEPHGLREPLLARVHAAAVDVGVVEEVDAGVASRADQGADLVVGRVHDAHQAEHDVGHLGFGRAEGDGSHEPP